jgi:hypothetical protein
MPLDSVLFEELTPVLRVDDLGQALRYYDVVPGFRTD